MGITISQPERRSTRRRVANDDDDDDDRANLKLSSHSVKSFNGSSTSFAKWRNHTESVLNGPGYARILTDEAYADTHPAKNSLVFSQLTMSTDDGSASHIVSKHKETQDGHQAWNDLMTYYHGSKLSVRTARAVRAKLSRLTLNEGTTASDYINKFQTWHRDLEAINEGSEGFSTDTKLQSFMDNIKHPKYAMTIGCLKNITELDMDIAIDRIRQTETELETERGEKRKMNVLRRAIYKEDGLIPTDEDEDLPGHNPVTPSPPHKKRRRRVDGSKNTNLPKEVQLKESGCIHIIEGWPELLNSDKEFVTAWNSRAKHGESTKDITIPTGVNLIPYARTASATFLKRIRRQIQEAKGPTEAMLKSNKKKISFGLEPDGDELEDVDTDMD